MCTLLLLSVTFIFLPFQPNIYVFLPCLEACCLYHHASHLSVNTTQLSNVGLLLGQCRRRWANITATLVDLLCWPDCHSPVCNGYLFISCSGPWCSQQVLDIEPMLIYCWYTVYDADPTLNHHLFLLYVTLDMADRHLEWRHTHIEQQLHFNHFRAIDR